MSSELPSAFAELEKSVTLFSRDGTPLDCNPATEQLLGYGQAEFLRAPLEALIVPHNDLAADDIREYIGMAAETGSASFEWQIQRGNGEPRWVQTTLSPITLEGTQYVIGELQDLTAYKARGRRLQLLYRVLRHNLRNEMNVIQGHAERLDDAIEGDDLTQQVEIIRDTAVEVGELSETVSDLERLVEKDATERERMHAATVVQTVVSEVEERHPDAQMQITIEAEATVSADEGFVLALDHALTNAIEHNENAVPEVGTIVDATDREAIIEISDNGPGIPEIEIDALDTEVTALEHGSGLGLSIIKWCTRSLGGSVDVTATGEGGSTLTIRLPRLD